MAQAKAKKPKASKAKSAARPKRAAAKKPASRKRTSATSKAKPATSSKAASSNGAGGKASANGHSNGHSSKAILPLLAGGAALAGTVGGVLIGASHSGGKVLGVNLPQPKRLQVKFKSSDLAKAAREVGRFGENVGDLTAELKKAREGLAGDNKHSSPIEVLLRGLTTRR